MPPTQKLAHFRNSCRGQSDYYYDPTRDTPRNRGYFPFLHYGAFRRSCSCRHQVQEAEARRKAERAAKFEEGRRLKQARSTLKSFQQSVIL